MKLNKNISGWLMYDFANSSFTTIIVTVIYSKYFVQTVVNNGNIGTALWGRAIAISMLLVALTAPIFGAVADFSRAKKKFLFYNTYITIVFTALLYFVRIGDVAKGMIFFIFANFGFNSANVFYNSLLPDITHSKDYGKVSGLGWGVGYIGGLLSLILVLPLVKAGKIVWVFPAVALFFFVFSLFTLFWVKEVKKASKRTNYFKMAFRRIHNSFINIRKFRELLKFIISYLVYNDAIVVVISFAALYGAQHFGMTSQQLIFYFIVANISSMIGAFIFGYILDKIGAKKTISITLIIWMTVIAGALMAKSIKQFYLVGLIAGIAIGSSQSASRTMLALLTPREKMAEFFGFYSFSGKMAAIIGPLIYGEVARITSSQQYSLIAISMFFVVGFILLQFVNEVKGKKVAAEWEKQ